MEHEIMEQPSYFVCPISLQIMADPVTLTSGISYDRHNIERWFHHTGGTAGSYMCPVTKQTVSSELTPNHTLRRLIESWCITRFHSSSPQDVDELRSLSPAYRSAVDPALIESILLDARSPDRRVAALGQLAGVIAESDMNKKRVESTPGAVEFLASVLKTSEEALAVLSSLQLSGRALALVVEKTDGSIIDSLVSILRKKATRSTSTSTLAALLLKSVVGVASSSRLSNLGEDMFQEVVDLLRDEISVAASKAAMEVLVSTCPSGRNRIKAANVGAVEALVDILLGEPDRRYCELALTVLGQVCGCAEGRAALVGHPAGIAVVSRRILGVSPFATERAVRMLRSVARNAAAPAVIQEMATVGAVGKLGLVANGSSESCTEKTKEKAREVLRMHSRVWRNFPCSSPAFLDAYIYT